MSSNVEQQNETSKEEDEYIVRSAIDPHYSPPNISHAEFLFEKVSERDPETIAIIDPNTDLRITYGELHRRAQEFASTLIELGVTKRDVVCFIADNSIEHAVSLVGTIYLGLTMGPISPLCRKFDAASAIRGCRGTVLVFGSNKWELVNQVLQDGEFVDATEKLRLFVVLGGDRPADSLVNNNKFFQERKILTYQQALDQSVGRLLERIPYFPIVEPVKEHFFYVPTSGTTGPSKRVIQSHRSFMAMINGLTVPAHGKVWQLWAPMGHSTGVVLFNQGLVCGASQVLFSTFSLDFYLESVQKYKINNLGISPDLANLMIANDYEKKYDLSSLQEIGYGSGSIATHVVVALRDKYKVPIINAYGSMEFYGHLQPDIIQVNEDFKPGSCDHVLPGVEMKVIDLVTRKALPQFQQGEVCFRGAQCFLGYLDNEEATKETIDEGGWYHSGDMGYYDESGAFFVTERIKEMIKYKMFSLVPGEIEIFLQRHEAVAACCVVGVPHTIDGNWIRAYVMKAEGKNVTEQDLIDYVSENLGSQKRLRAGVRFVTEMPRSALGKITRSYFKDLVKDEMIDEIEL